MNTITLNYKPRPYDTANNLIIVGAPIKWGFVEVIWDKDSYDKFYHESLVEKLDAASHLSDGDVVMITAVVHYGPEVEPTPNDPVQYGKDIYLVSVDGGDIVEVSVSTLYHW